MVHVIAVITTLPGKREEVLAEFKKLVPLVHAEQGCIEYQPIVDATGVGEFQTALGSDTYIVVEKWETLQDLEACLLYTSPSPRDKRQSRMPSSA